MRHELRLGHQLGRLCPVLLGLRCADRDLRLRGLQRQLLLHFLHLLGLRVWCAHLVKRRHQFIAVRQRAVVDDALQDQRQHRGVWTQGLKQTNELLLLVLTGDDAQSCSRDELHVRARITLRVKLHVPERRLLNERDQEVLLEVDQRALVLLDHRSDRHAHARAVAVALADHALAVQRARGLQQHALELFGRVHVVQTRLAELERVQNFGRVAVDHERFARLDLEPSTTRQPGGVHAHHGRGRQRQTVQVAAHLGVNRLLHVVGLLHRAPAQQAVGHCVVLVGEDWAVLHHVGVRLGLEQHAIVGDHDNRLHQVRIVVGCAVVGEQINGLLVFLQLLQILTRHQAVVRQQTHFFVLILAQFLGWLQISVLGGWLNVHLAVNTLLDAFDDLVDAHILLNRHAHAVVNRRAVGVKQEILGVDGHDLDGDAAFLHHTNGRLPHLPWDRPSCGLKHLFGLDDDLANARAVDFGHQFDLVDGFSDLVLLEVLHELRFEHANVNRVLVDVLQVVFDVEKLTLTKYGLHHFSVPSLHGLLGGGGHDP